jgi:hypothetical protein
MRWARIVLVVLVGCAGAEATTQPPQQPAHPDAPAAGSGAANELGLDPGETMAFEVRLAGVLAGEAQLAVGNIGEVGGRREVVVKSRAATAGAAALFKQITDETTTVIDADTGRPLQLDSTAVVDGKTTSAHAEFGTTGATVTFTRDGDPHAHAFRVGFAGKIAYDTHSAMAQLRGWHASPGATRTVYVVGGRRLWRVDVTLVGSEAIGSAMGNRRTVHIEGAAFRARPNLTLESETATRTFSVWLTDDADRVPLKVVAKTELGDVAMDLTEYNRP